MDKKEISRRTFIFGTALTAAGCATGTGFAPRTTRPRRVSPNEKLNIAAIGVGGKGRSDVAGCASENIVALCDVDWRSDRDVHDTFNRYPNAAKYKDFREMLDKEGNNIDAVTVTTPDHTHAVAAMYCMQMGKHVYVQKPLTWSVGEARMLQKAARRYGVVTQMGNQGHAGEGVRQLCEMIWNGDIGQVREVHIWTNRPVWPQGVGRPAETPPVPPEIDWDLWIGPAPMRPYHDKAYAPFNWRGWWDFGCGALGDMACHIADPANWALKLYETGPISVEAIKSEGGNDETYPKNSIIRYEFPARNGMDPVTVYWYDGGNKPKMPEGVPPETVLGDGNNGSLFIGTRGIATAGEYGGKARLLPDSLMADYTPPAPTIPRVPGNNPYREWIDAIKNDTQPGSNFDYSGPFTEWVVMGNLALRFPQKLEWNAKKMKVTNVPEANEYIMREFRKGWEPGD